MRRSLAFLALPAALLWAGSLTANADPASGPRLPPRLIQPQPDPYATTTFDLGVDVSNVPLTRQGVGQFLQTLTPEGQSIIASTCRNYLGDPSQVRTRRTLDFCQVVVSG